MRASIVVSESTDASGLILNFRVALWLAVPTLAQTPLSSSWSSIVPLQSGQAAGTTWAIAGITSAELAALQSGAYFEQQIVLPIPKAIFTDAGTATCIDAFYSYWQGVINAAVPPSSVDYVGASGNKTTIAAASNGQSLPQSTINVVSTAGMPSTGAAFVFTVAGAQMVVYTGITSTTLTGCTGGTGAMATGGDVWVFTAA
jgi:hypothetical protein